MGRFANAPDLGAFTTVFRALETLQPRMGNGHLTDVESTTPSSLAFLQPDYDSELAAGSTVWLRDPVASYLSYSDGDVWRLRMIPRMDDAFAEDNTMLSMIKETVEVPCDPSLKVCKPCSMSRPRSRSKPCSVY
ncbi:hypothetical protein B0H21DRAFT_763570 [Amylocystis lapponica]|nr:hypothetical protein B0H21DRAFT_763570 [Amylocystis lapponica]